MSVSVRIDEDDPTPPYEQLRRQLATLVESGALAAGSRLPPVRQLAADLALATGTVARAYRELERTGLVLTRRGGGTTVAAPRNALSEPVRRERIRRLVRDAVRQAALLGASEADVREAVDDALGRTGAGRTA